MQPSADKSQDSCRTRPWRRRQPVKNVCHSAMARSMARPAAVTTKLQPHHDTASGTDSHSPGAIAIGRNTPGVSLCSRTGASYIDSRCRLIGLSEAFCSCRIGRRLLLRRRFGNWQYEKCRNKQGKCQSRLRGLHHRLLFKVSAQCTVGVRHDIG